MYDSYKFLIRRYRAKHSSHGSYSGVWLLTSVLDNGTAWASVFCFFCFCDHLHVGRIPHLVHGHSATLHRISTPMAAAGRASWGKMWLPLARKDVAPAGPENFLCYPTPKTRAFCCVKPIDSIACPTWDGTDLSRTMQGYNPLSHSKNKA